MPRRIEVELTSARDDGSWTWRAAGAKQPKGVLDGALLPGGAQVGDVLRADAEFDVDGITVVAVLPPREARPEPERIDLLPPAPPPPPRYEDHPGERPRRGGPKGPRSERERRPRADRPARAERAPRPERPERAPRPEPAPPKPRPKRLRPQRVHRDAVLADLPPEHGPIAQQLLKGGLPAVRNAVDEQNAALRAEGKPEVKADALMSLAEELLPGLRTAEWRDRAEAALADVEELDLRDLRSVVVAADDAARDDATRALAAEVRDALNRRVEREHADWLHELTTTLSDGRVVRALRLSSRPPKAGSRFPADLASRLAEAASASLTAEVSQDRWATVLEAVAFSPVRRAVTPKGFPEKPGDELLAAVRRFADRVPEIAAHFGVDPLPASERRPPARRPPRREKPRRPREAAAKRAEPDPTGPPESVARGTLEGDADAWEQALLEEPMGSLKGRATTDEGD